MANFEGAHWYATQKTVDMGMAIAAGDSVWEVPGAKGTPVKPNVSHAIEYGLVQGATSVLGMLNKPQLFEWASKQAIKGATLNSDGQFDFHNSPAARLFRGEINYFTFETECLRARDEVGKKAAEGGTLLHGFVENGVKGIAQEPEGEAVWQTVKTELDKTWPGVQWLAEIPAIDEQNRFGCRTDLLGMVPDNVVVVDLKTRDFESEDVAKAFAMKAKGYKTLGRLTPRETEPMQIAANLKAHGASFAGENRGANLYLSRTDRNAVYLHIYTEEQLDKAWVCFLALNTVYRTLKGLP